LASIAPHTVGLAMQPTRKVPAGLPMLILPKPVEDEFVPGYIGRLTHVNLSSSCFETMCSLVNHFNLDQDYTPLRGQYYQAESHLNALALASGKSVGEIIRYHTNFDAEGLTPDVVVRWLHCLMRRRKGSKQYSESKRPYLCRECIQQQVRDVGFSFWHRQHQLDGLYWCPVHRTALLAADDWLTKDAFVPVATAASVRTPATAKDFDTYPVLQSFCEIMMGFLRHPLWMSVARIEDYLRRRAAARGLSLGGGVARVPSDSLILDDLAFRECPIWWLDEVFGLRNATAGKGRIALNSVFSGGGFAPPVSYALAMALLLSPRERADILDGSSPSSGRV